MKTIKRITALLIAMLAISLSAALFTACSGSHTCEYETAWTSDETYHWHKCKDADCTETSEKIAHVWDDGVETTAATVYAKGVKTYTCKDCGKTKTEDVSVTGNDAYFSALKDSVLKMQQSGSMYVINTSSTQSSGGSTSTGINYATWNANGVGTEKSDYTSTSGSRTTYDLVNSVDGKYYYTEIIKGETSVIDRKEYVSADYWTKYGAEGLAEVTEQMSLPENDLKTMLIYSLKSMAGEFDFVDSTTKNEINVKDVADENIIYVCTVSTENGVAKIEASVSFKNEWLSGVSAGEGVSVKKLDMKMTYAFTADKITKAESQYGITMVMAGQETANSMYQSCEFDTNFNQSLFDEAVAVEATCADYEGTVGAHWSSITVYVNGEEYMEWSVAYDDKAAAKTTIDEQIIKNNVKHPLQENNGGMPYDETKDTVVVKAYLDKECTIEYTEENKNDLVIDCYDGGKIYLKVTPIDENKTVVLYSYKVSSPAYTYTRTKKFVLADRTSGYEIITAPSTYEPDDKYEDEITVDGTALAEGVTTVDLSGKASVVIICTRNGME